MATKLELMAKAAQGEDTSAKLAAETKKLNNNIALDKAAAGQASTFLTFDGQAGAGTPDAEVAAPAEDDAVADDEEEELEVCTTKRVKKSKL